LGKGIHYDMGITSQDISRETKKLYRLGAVGVSIQIVVQNAIFVATMYLLISWTSVPINFPLYTGLYLISNITDVASTILISRGFQAIYRESNNRFAYYAALGYLAVALFSVAGFVSPSASSYFVPSVSGIVTSALGAVVFWLDRSNVSYSRLYLAMCLVFLLCTSFSVFALVRNIQFILYPTMLMSNPLFIPNFISCGIIRPILLFSIFFGRMSQIP
jgi:hypothetical protein